MLLLHRNLNLNEISFFFNLKISIFIANNDIISNITQELAATFTFPFIRL